MAKTLFELKTKLKRIRQDVKDQLEAIAVEMANSGKALAERKIISSGIEGAAYSEVGVPAFFFQSKQLNNKGRDFLKKKQKVSETVTWGDFREAQGLQSEFVDLYYSGDMWKNIVVVRVEAKGAKVVAFLGGKSKSSADKLKWNAARYGEFIIGSLTEQNKAFIKKVADNKIKKILEQANL